MELTEILKNQNPKHVIGDIKNLNIKKLACDTKYVEDGSLFFCLKGEYKDGHNFAETAIFNGAQALVVERPLFIDIPQIVVESSRETMTYCAANFFKNPQEKLKLIGVTGTNGKTSTTYIIESILKQAGLKVGVIGTIGTVIDGKKFKSKLTTPDPIEFYEILSRMVKEGVDVVVMEVSAHAIALKKVFASKFDVGILTNVTQDHLDYFKSFENYKQTKQNFLNSNFCKSVVVNVDDECGREIFLKKSQNFKVLSYGLKNPSDVFAVRTSFSMNGTISFLNLLDDIFEINTKLCGEFNLYNILASVTACKLLGVENKFIEQGVNAMESVEGRFNVIDLGNDKKAVLDYAHTPDGLKNILTAVRQITKGQIISVFGCGGNRDSKKRPIMGEISGSLADFSIITSDNPRFEDPIDIIKDVEDGIIETTSDYLCIEDRKEAIRCGLAALKPGDVLIVSGKGAEDYVDIRGVKYPYSDRQTILEENDRLKKEFGLI